MASTASKNCCQTSATLWSCQSIPLHVKVFAAWLTGLVIGYFFDLPVELVLWASLLLVASSVVLPRAVAESWRLSALLLAVVLAGACRWEMAEALQQDPYHASIVQLDGVFHGTIHSIPVVYRRSDSAWSMPYGSSERTTFEFLVQLPDSQQQVTKREVWQVSLDGNARGLLACGDTVTIRGQAVRSKGPTNPGQFDYSKMLASRGVARRLFVNHFSAIQVVEQAPWWNLFRWASWLRADAERILETSLDGANQQLAIAMFLGNRSQLPYELRDAFVASGTMHLLAISGLHVGILSLFVIRLFHVLGVSREKALLAMMIVICSYAMITGFRPSVVRATLFLVLFGCSQLLGKPQKLHDLLSLTALIMTMWCPELLVDTGAWLSFLSVGALAWYGCQTDSRIQQHGAPEEQRSATQVLLSGIVLIKKKAVQRYLQMLSILLFTLPLTTSVFHVFSIVSLLVNVLLILYAFFVLGAGYLTLLVGVLLPVCGWIPASLFSLLLSVFSWIVNWAADLSYGHFYLSDFPTWFLPLWYGALAAMLVSRTAAIRRGVVIVLVVIAVAGFGLALQEPQNVGLTVTVLDIGHGSAAVIECGDQVVLVDAGSLNQGRRAAEVVSSFLWARGWNHIDKVLISHADSDHYNAVPALISRFPIGQIVTSEQFIQSTDEAVQEFMTLVRHKGVLLRTVTSGTEISLATGQLQILQADSTMLPDMASDNETSLVVRVGRDGLNVLLPGDLEEDGLQLLLPKLGKSRVLVSPHHGSRGSNSVELAQAVMPHFVIVSARDTTSRQHLESVYSDAGEVWWTSESGAVQLAFQNGRIEPCAFRSADE